MRSFLLLLLFNLRAPTWWLKGFWMTCNLIVGQVLPGIFYKGPYIETFKKLVKKIIIWTHLCIYNFPLWRVFLVQYWQQVFNSCLLKNWNSVTWNNVGEANITFTFFGTLCRLMNWINIRYTYRSKTHLFYFVKI